MSIVRSCVELFVLGFDIFPPFSPMWHSSRVFGRVRTILLKPHSLAPSLFPSRLLSHAYIYMPWIML